jgi:hypothetical protein
MILKRATLYAAGALGLLLAGPSAALPGITFQDIAANGGAGFDFSHAPSTRYQFLLDALANGFIDVPTEYFPAPFKPNGVPGVAIFDYDGDGDLDVYASNGPGTVNSLFANQLADSGSLQFVDVAHEAGVELTDQDSQGVCYGDIDNDDDKDLLVLGFLGTHHLFENNGNGTFADITASSHVSGQDLNGVSCAMGDVDNDGFLDIAIANTFDFTHQFALTTQPFIHNQPNLLYHNDGDNTFSDVSVSSGLRTKVVFPQHPADLSWSISMVDYDKDGDVDIFLGQDMRTAAMRDTVLRLYRNDGTGHFTDFTADAHLNVLGSWRGLTFGDLNCDGRMDLFATNIGAFIFFPGPPPGRFSSAAFFQQADGTFVRQSLSTLVTIPTGWGDSLFDYDNDGDLDVVLYGNQDSPLFWDVSNPGVVLENAGSCSGNFQWDQNAISLRRHTRRIVEGLATGDLNDDGFDDIVSISSFNVPASSTLSPDFTHETGSPFDATAHVVFVTLPTSNPNSYKHQGDLGIPGSLAVEISSGNGNNWAKASLVGTVGITSEGRANRDGAGAVVSYTRPLSNNTTTSVTRPVAGGSSMLSQGSPELTFGLGTGRRGLIEVLWPGGTRNRLYDVRPGERVSIPEIPCSYDASWQNPGAYVTCVVKSLDEIRDAGLIDNAGRARLLQSALNAYHDYHGIPF